MIQLEYNQIKKDSVVIPIESCIPNGQDARLSQCKHNSAVLQHRNQSFYNINILYICISSENLYLMLRNDSNCSSGNILPLFFVEEQSFNFIDHIYIYIYFRIFYNQHYSHSGKVLFI